VFRHGLVRRFGHLGFGFLVDFKTKKEHRRPEDGFSESESQNRENKMPGNADLEDSAHAIFTLVVVSNAATGIVRAGFQSHFCRWVNARAKSYMSEKDSGDPLIQLMRLRKTMNPFTAEFFAQGIMRRLGIRTVPQKICTASEARALSADYVVKIAGREPAQSLNWKPSMALTGWCLASRLVPDAASLDYVARKLVTTHSAQTQVLQQCAALHAEKDLAIEELIAKTLGKTCIPADKFFADFKPTSSEIQTIKSAMALDGEKYLSICAARVFLGSSAPHFANVLITKSGELVSIDHARAAYEDNSDLKELFYFIARSSVPFKTLDAVAGLSEDDIHAAVDEIPAHPACSSTAGFADYFCKRLERWKKLHAREIPASAEMTSDPQLTCWNPGAFVGREIADEAAALARAWK
jgi:hypothetical protein